MNPFFGQNYEENERKLQINKKILSPMGITQKMLELTKS